VADGSRAERDRAPAGEPASDGSGSGARDRGASGGEHYTENWYQHFCGPVWDPAVIVPCGVYGNGVSYHGCRSATNAFGGALTVASGDAELDDVVVLAYDVRAGALVIVLQGPQKVATGLPFGDGVRCIGGSLKRLYTGQAAGGTFSAPDAGEASIRTRSAALGDPIPSPAVRYYQVWYLDGPGHFNITSGLQINWP
jgi:hypothetical protein